MIGRKLTLRYPSWGSKSGAELSQIELWRSLLHTDNYLIAAFMDQLSGLKEMLTTRLQTRQQGMRYCMRAKCFHLSALHITLKRLPQVKRGVNKVNAMLQMQQKRLCRLQLGKHSLHLLHLRNSHYQRCFTIQHAENHGAPPTRAFHRGKDVNTQGGGAAAHRMLTE